MGAEICKCGHAHTDPATKTCPEFGCACWEWRYPTTRYQTTEYNRSERLLRRLHNIYSRARIYHEWRVLFDGRLIPGKEVPEGRWNEVVSDKGAHVWVDAPERIF